MELSNQLPGSHPLTAPVHPPERVTGPPELHHSEGRYLLLEHQCQMQEQGLYEKQGLVFLSPDTFTNVYDHLLGRVWHRSLQRCGLPPRRLYAQRHSFLSHALAMGNSPADLAQIASHSTEILLKTYAKPTGRVKLPSWFEMEN